MSYGLSSISDLREFEIPKYSAANNNESNVNITKNAEDNIDKFDGLYFEISKKNNDNTYSSYKINLKELLLFSKKLDQDPDDSPYISRVNETQPIKIQGTNIGYNQSLYPDGVYLSDFLLANDIRLNTNFLRADGSIADHNTYPNVNNNNDKNLIPYMFLNDETRALKPSMQFEINTGNSPLKVKNIYNQKNNVIEACATSAIWN